MLSSRSFHSFKFSSLLRSAFCTNVPSQFSQPKQLPKYITNFEDLIDPNNNYAFVDKSLLIKSIFANKQNSLILRPRGWGKTLNLSMLKSFLSIHNKKNKLVAETFSKLKIGSEENKQYISSYGFKFPVIHLNLNLQYDVNPSFADLRESFFLAIQECFQEHRYLLQSPLLSQEDKDFIKLICEGTFDKIEENPEVFMQNALNQLSEMLYKHFEMKSIVLIDNYDVPAYQAMMEGFYNEMLHFIQGFFSRTLDLNLNLHKAVIMGAFPITKAYIFPNLKSVCSATFLNPEFEESYGFNENEVQGLIKQISVDPAVDLYEDIYLNLKGYYSHASRRKDIYSPISVLKSLEGNQNAETDLFDPDKKKELDLLYHLYTKTKPHDYQDIIGLTTQKFVRLERNVFWHIIDKLKSHPERKGLFLNPTKIWSVMFFTGFLTLCSQPMKVGTHYVCNLQVPNKEILNMFQYLRNRNKNEKEFLLEELRTGLRTKNLKKFFHSSVLILRQRSLWGIYFRENFEKERHYHDYLEILIGQLNLEEEFELISEEKSGEGRVDMMLIPKETSGIRHAFIFELKFTNEFDEVKSLIGTALAQIRYRDYINRLNVMTHIDEVVIAGVVGTDRITMHHASAVVPNKKILSRNDTDKLIWG